MHTYTSCLSAFRSVMLPPLPTATIVRLGAAAAGTVRHCLKALGAGTTPYLSARLCWHAAQVPAGHSSLWFETAPTWDSGLCLWVGVRVKGYSRVHGSAKLRTVTKGYSAQVSQSPRQCQASYCDVGDAKGTQLSAVLELLGHAGHGSASTSGP